MANKVKRRSTSFSREEIELACAVTSGLLSGKDLTVLASRKECAQLASKFGRMRSALTEDEG